MKDEPHAAWALSLRERLHRRFLRAITKLGRYWEQAKEWENAVEWYERGLAVDDLVEEFYQRQMVCYRRLGRRTEALTVYQRCRRTLATQLRVTPSSETEAIYQTMRVK